MNDIRIQLAEGILDSLFNFAEKVAYRIVDARYDSLMRAIDKHPKLIRMAQEMQASKKGLDSLIAKEYQNNPEFRAQIDMLRKQGKI